MKVYFVIAHDYEGSFLEAIFASEEKAVEKCNELNDPEQNPHSYYCGKYEVEEHEVIK